MNKLNIFPTVFFPAFALVGALLKVGLRLSVGELVGFLALPIPFFLDFAMVGVAVGAADGLALRAANGLAVGAADGLAVGAAVVGLAVGAAVVGLAVGTAVGLAVGVADGLAVGAADGLAVGAADGLAVGTAVGLAVGVADGLAVGAADGLAVGLGVLGHVSTAQKGPSVEVGMALFVHPEYEKILPFVIDGIVFFHGHKFWLNADAL